MAEPKRMILAARSSGLESYSGTAFHPATAAEALRAFHEAGLWVGPRETLEREPAFRQIIPYVVLRCGDRVLRYTRTPAGGESRLHGRVSIGLGGHIDLSDLVCDGDTVNLAATLSRAAEREVLEEVGQVDVAAREWVGLLTDDSNEVGRVHIGAVAVWHLRKAPDGLSEDAIGDVALHSLEELGRESARLETWSALLVPHLEDSRDSRAAA